MAAITQVTVKPNGFYPSFRTGTAQADTGQTDWLQVPAWANFLEVFFNLTAVGASTTPVSTVSFLAVPPGIYDDTDVVQIATGAAITAISQHRYVIGPGVSGIADGTDSTTADAEMRINSVLPTPVIGIKLLLDRGTGDEVYTYTLTARFIRA